MKKKSYLLLATTLLAGGIAIVSCNQEDDDWDEMDVSLDVTSRTPMTKSNASDGFEINEGNTYYATIRKNKSFTPQDNCCAVTALVYAWIDSMGDGYFSNPQCPMTAQGYYDSLVTQIASNSDYQWTPDSQSMKMSTLMSVCNDIPYKNDKHLFSDYNEFENSGTDPNAFFSDKENRRTVGAILL